MRYHHRLIVELFKKKTLKHSHSEFGLVPEMVWQKPRLQKEQQNSSKPIRGATHSICILSIISIGSRIAVAWFLSSICFSCRSSRTTELTMSVEVVFGLFLFRREKRHHRKSGIQKRKNQYFFVVLYAAIVGAITYYGNDFGGTSAAYVGGNIRSSPNFSILFLLFVRVV